MTRFLIRLTARAQAGRNRSTQPDLGQATAEYALVLLGAAMVALILVGWATGGGAGSIAVCVRCVERCHSSSCRTA